MINGNENKIKDLVLFDHSELENPPDKINDKFSSVLGNAFYFMDRIKVPINHYYEKRFFVLLQEALFV